MKGKEKGLFIIEVLTCNYFQLVYRHSIHMIWNKYSKIEHNMIKKQIGRGGGGGGVESTTWLMAISTNKFFKLISIRFLKWLIVRISKRLKNFAFRRLWEQSFLLIFLGEKSSWSLKGEWSKGLSTLQIVMGKKFRCVVLNLWYNYNTERSRGSQKKGAALWGTYPRGFQAHCQHPPLFPAWQLIYNVQFVSLL